MVRIVRLEWRLVQRDWSVRCVAILLLSAGLYGLANGRAWMVSTMRAMELTQVENARWRDASASRAKARAAADMFSDATNAAAVRVFAAWYASMPVWPLAFVSVGQADVLPRSFRVTGERRASFLDAEEIDNPVNLLHGRFDLAFVLVTFLPLLALALSYNAVSGDREHGTLSLVLAQPIRLIDWVRVRLGLRAVLLLALMGCLLVGVLVAGARHVVSSRPLVAVGILGGTTVAWVVLWLALGAAASTASRSTSTNALAALMLWLVMLVVSPTVLNAVAQSRYPVPPRTRLIAHGRDRELELRNQASSLLDRYYRAHPDRRPAGHDTSAYNFPLYWNAIQDELDRRTAPTLLQYDAALADQQQFVMRWVWLAPGLALQELMNEVAGTDTTRHLRFVAQVGDYHRRRREFFEAKAYRLEPLTATDYERMPDFVFEEEPVRPFVSRLLRCALVIAGWAVAAMVVTGRRLSRIVP